MATFEQKSAFVQYTELYRQLHDLIERGLGESSQADAIRDRMDEPWSRLTREEIAVIDQLPASPGENGDGPRGQAPQPPRSATGFPSPSERG